MNLSNLFKKYGSDKFEHGYAEFYQENLPANPDSILEIGVKGGASINAWCEAYPHARILGMDLFVEFPIPDIPNVEWFKGNQLDGDLLYHIRNDVRPQVIIEDASHNCINHWVTLFSLIPGCQYYFIEDLTTCLEPFYRQGLAFDQTVLGSMLNGTFPFEFLLSPDHKIAVIKNTI